MGKPSCVAKFLVYVLFVAALCVAGWSAYDIRLYAIKNYGLVIHEFDPWFNFRATQYLADNGYQKFFKWFDYMSWYPLGRPVGTTIYPGMQLSSVLIWNTLKSLGEDWAMSLNDVCVYVPAWFGVSATVFLGLLAGETSGSWSSGVVAALIMSVIPAHFMRSVGGGYDNESVAMTAMCATFYFWCRSLRKDPELKNGEATRDSVFFGICTGFAYIYMVAAWGGFVFVLNLIGVHAAALALTGRFTSKLHRAYSLFYFIGTIGAIQVPVVGWGPLKSLEQLGPLVVFVGFQLLEYVEIQRRAKNLNILQVFKLRLKVFTPVVLAGVALVLMLLPTGYFGPFSARVRGLFVKHTRTGNPLVDSVAEHQPASEQAYEQYLQHVYHLAPFGFALSVLNWTDANTFVVTYSIIAYYFSSKMARLVILLGPVASCLGGVAVGFLFDQLFFYALQGFFKKQRAAIEVEEESIPPTTEVKKETKKAKPTAVALTNLIKKVVEPSEAAYKSVKKVYNGKPVVLLRLFVGIFLFRAVIPKIKDFYTASHKLAEQMSQPSLMFKATLRNGQQVMVDDYREAYWWLRDNTPEDSRVMAWWDYGYQIAGMANRTTIADGNTWNHEHIATLGRCLSAPEKQAHRIAKHLADYVLVWAGGGGDDLAKSPHMARIGNSVYPDICPGDPTCAKFGFYQGGVPTSMMKKSLLYKMTQVGYKPDVKLDPSRFVHAYTSKYGKVRIFKVQQVSQKSKEWIADPANRVCDAPGSWYCSGQYPPALQPLIAKRKNFKQLEDFNVGANAESAAYHEDYMARMSGKKRASRDDFTNDGDDEDEEQEPPQPPVNLEYVGCFGRESSLGKDKVYGGGVTGANIELAVEYAMTHGKKYMALARVSNDGHSFFFNNPVSEDEERLTDSGCERTCMNQGNFRCGCSDDGCGDLSPVAGEEHRRRWSVYAIPDADLKAKKDKKAQKAKKDTKDTKKKEKTDKKQVPKKGKSDKKDKTEL